MKKWNAANWKRSITVDFDKRNAFFLKMAFPESDIVTWVPEEKK